MSMLYGYIGKKTNNIFKLTIASENDPLITENDRLMDMRAEKAVAMAIEKAKLCGKPIAKYNEENKKAYLEFPDGRIEYV